MVHRNFLIDACDDGLEKKGIKIAFKYYEEGILSFDQFLLCS